MGKISVCKIFTFEAAHSLPEYKGSCHNLHGHSYKLEIEVSGEPDIEGPDAGMLIDFKKLKNYIQTRVIDVYDHKLLNSDFENPTAENMVLYIASTLSSSIKSFGVELERVRLWETATSYAQWTAY